VNPSRKLFLTIALLLLTVTDQKDVKQKFPFDLESSTDSDLYSKFVDHFGKAYAKDSPEAKARFVHFQRNLAHVKQRNKELTHYKLEINHLSDQTPAEMQQRLGLLHDASAIASLEAKEHGKKKIFLSNKLKKGKQTAQYAPVNWSSNFLDARNQQTCGSCWAFSFTGMMEAYISIQGGVKQYLSPQFLLNCDTQDQACNGGAFSYTFPFAQNNGLILDALLPYQNVQNTCDNTLAAQVLAGTKITGFQWCSNASSTKQCTEDIVYSFLSTGPVNVGIDGGSSDFQHYAAGVFTGACSASNHAVIIAGYGIEPTSGQYWLVRNSWGVGWGENGFVRISRNSTNNSSCFLIAEAFAPTFN